MAVLFVTQTRRNGEEDMKQSVRQTGKGKTILLNCDGRYHGRIRENIWNGFHGLCGSQEIFVREILASWRKSRWTNNFVQKGWKNPKCVGLHRIKFEKHHSFFDSIQFFRKNHEKADEIILVVDVVPLVQQIFSNFHQTFKIKLIRMTTNFFKTFALLHEEHEPASPFQISAVWHGFFTSIFFRIFSDFHYPTNRIHFRKTPQNRRYMFVVIGLKNYLWGLIKSTVHIRKHSKISHGMVSV